MRLLICGSRSWDDYPIILRALRAIIDAHGRPELVIHGAARGADTFGGAAAGFLGIQVREFPADWAKDGRAAGPIRNHRMLHFGEPTHLLAFAPTFAVWSGTMHMMTIADNADVQMACLNNREQCENWIEHGCPFGPMASWVVVPEGGIGKS